jgi:hypothetical protein
VKKGIDQGRRPELTGGGLVRSLGGWSMVKKLRLKGQDRIKGDERILGDSEFVTALLSEAKEKLERSYKLNTLGYDLKKISQMVSRIYDIETEEIYSKGKRKGQGPVMLLGSSGAGNKLHGFSKTIRNDSAGSRICSKYRRKDR